MISKELVSIIANENSTIKETARIIDKARIGHALVTNNDDIFIGIVNDGDIRGSIVKGIDVNEPVKNIARKDAIFLYEKDLQNSITVKKTLDALFARSPTSRFIPILDEKKHVKNMLLCSELRKGNIARFGGKKAGITNPVKKVLVVGGAGYLGSVLTRKLLKKEYKVRVLDLFLFGEESLKEIKNDKNLEIIRGDIRNIETITDSLKEVDAVIHLAAIVGDPACSSRPEAAVETNYLATKALAEACKYHQINHFIFASTCSVYGKGNGSLTEESSLNPVSLYARSKIKSEEGILSLVDDNFSPCMLRMGTLYGMSPRMRFDLVVNTLAARAITDKKISIFGGKQWRPLLNVDDAAEAYIKCLEAPIEKIKGEVFNVGSDNQNYQIFQIGDKVKEVIPETTIINTDSEIIQGEIDERDYKVSFDKIAKTLGYSTKKTVKEEILNIKKAIESRQIINPWDKKYHNIRNE